MRKIFEYIMMVMVYLQTLILAVEDEGATGAAKKQVVKELIKEGLEKMAAEGKIPSWVAGILTFDLLLDMLIDRIVGYANKTGIFEKAYEVLEEKIA